MTHQHALTAAEPDPAAQRAPLPAAMRLAIALPLAFILAVVGLVAASLTGWGFETEALDQLRRDAAWLLVVAAAGASVGGLVAWGAAARRRLVIGLVAAAGLLPAVVLASAYFTDRY